MGSKISKVKAFFIILVTMCGTANNLKRFLKKVYPEPNTGCWLWSGKVSEKGYGYAYASGKKYRYAHRVSFFFHNGPFDISLHVLHKCDNTYCVNPDHLFLGTNQDNILDRMRKGRNFDNKGSKNGKAIITEEIVSDMRRLKCQGIKTTEIAKRYNVSENLARLAILGYSWSHV